MVKKLLLSCASIFLIWQSYQLLETIHHFDSTSWIAIIFMAWIINLYITGVFAFAGFAFPTQKLLPQGYYKISQPRRLKSIYKNLGVDTFRKMLLATLWRNQKQREKFFNGTKSGIQNLETQSMKSEFGHLIPFVLINVVGIYLIFNGTYRLAVATLIINVVGNLYPIILQRYHQMRIAILKKRYS